MSPGFFVGFFLMLLLAAFLATVKTVAVTPPTDKVPFCVPMPSYHFRCFCYCNLENITQRNIFCVHLVSWIISIGRNVLISTYQIHLFNPSK